MKFKNALGVLAGGAVSALLLALPQDAEATPVFARQTGMSCTACHFQRFPMLNAFGRDFKARGYVMKGSQQTIEDKDLSIPSSLNLGLVTKLRYQKKNGTTTTGPDGMLNDGEFQIPDEAFLSVGGRVAENIGFQTELNLANVSTGGVFAAFKMPFVFDLGKEFIANVIPFTTDTQGPAYGFELLNTGAVRFSRAFENRTETSAQQYIGTATAATGAALVAYHKYGYLNFSPYVKRGSNADPIFSSGQMFSYLRGAVTPTIGGWDLAAGFQVWNGDARYTEAVVDATTDPVTTTYPETSQSANAWAVDAQAQGNVGELPLGVYLTYGSADNAATNIYTKGAEALTLAAELGVIPYKLTLGAAYRSASNGKATLDGEDAVTLGMNYLVAKNVTVQINHSFYSYDANLDAKGDNLTTVMLYSAF
ncbi:hypothetical protein [Pelodictyon luteolum]|uniref:Cytochrome C n=1 Tax=Chlorobium luteolum (strain DSM 273 / BCRC 81028 / 2530) TaxID=319225 RepID=Q3B2Y0_CHLL3|nr:hypothetical protein [Pelodictyon luteolum]ABB24301.1 hypothetical protein Plut_1442 [Pelodictyon luteolum DSM 273]